MLVLVPYQYRAWIISGSRRLTSCHTSRLWIYLYICTVKASFSLWQFKLFWIFNNIWKIKLKLMRDDDDEQTSTSLERRTEHWQWTSKEFNNQNQKTKKKNLLSAMVTYNLLLHIDVLSKYVWSYLIIKNANSASWVFMYVPNGRIPFHPSNQIGRSMGGTTRACIAQFHKRIPMGWCTNGMQESLRRVASDWWSTNTYPGLFRFRSNERLPELEYSTERYRW